MRLGDLMRSRPELLGMALVTPEHQALAAFEISGLTADSRAVRPGFLFAALPGQKADGRDFIADAVARGAAVVLAETGTQWPAGVPPRAMLQDPDPRRRFAVLASAFHRGQPGTLVGVTGTNGKTSTVEFLRQIWQSQGNRAASLGTLGLVAEGMPPEPGLTTPEPVALHRTLASLAEAGVSHAALEASSHGLVQCRLDGVRFAAGAFTNLTRDHLDFHGTMEAYREAKLRLFDALLPQGAPAVVSTTLDEETRLRLAVIAARRRLALASTGPGGTLWNLRVIEALPEGLRVETEGEELVLRLIGAYQADNVALAAGIARATGTARKTILSALPLLAGVRGRLERASRLPSGASVYVDYAHTPDALARVVASIRPHALGRVILVFGAGGDRDPGKRPLMGEAAQAADLAIVTDDNPRSEDPALIRAAVLEGCPGAIEIGGRAEAIGAAIDELREGDVAVIAGKGHEQGQIVAGQVLPFDDLEVARSAAAARGGVA